MNKTIKIVAIVLICAALSGCVSERNADGFAVGEIREYDFPFKHAGYDTVVSGTIEWDGEQYLIDAEFEVVIEGILYTAREVGPVDNVRVTVYGPGGMADVSYHNCEGTPLLKAILLNAK